MNSKLNNNAIVKLIKNNFDVEVSGSTVRRALQEKDYHIFDRKLSLKIQKKNR